MVCVLQKKQHELRKLEVLSPPNRIGESGKKKLKQGQRDRDLIGFDRTTRLHFRNSTKDQTEVENSIIFEVEHDPTCPEPEGWSHTG